MKHGLSYVFFFLLYSAPRLPVIDRLLFHIFRRFFFFLSFCRFLVHTSADFSVWFFWYKYLTVNKNEITKIFRYLGYCHLGSIMEIVKGYLQGSIYCEDAHDRRGNRFKIVKCSHTTSLAKSTRIKKIKFAKSK